MPSPFLFMEKYIENINQAIADSRIEFISKEARSCLDDYSHLLERKIDQGIYPAVLGEYNTRRLSDYSSELLDSIIKTKKSVKILELGAGSGRAAYDMYCLAKTSGIDISIDTVALTPFAPNYRLLSAYTDMVEGFADFFAEKSFAGEPQWVKDVLYFYYQMYKWKVDPKISPFKMLNKSDFTILINEARNRPWGLPTYAAFELNKLGYNFFKPCVDYINKQFIGELIDNRLIYDNKYDFIHDQWGALHYTLRYESDIIMQRKLIENLLSIMNENSTLYIANIRENKSNLFQNLKFKELNIQTIPTTSKSIEVVAKF